MFERVKRTKEEQAHDMFVSQIKDFITIMSETKAPTPRPISTLPLNLQRPMPLSI